MGVTIASASRRSGVLSTALQERIPSLQLVAGQVFTPAPVQDKAGVIRQVKVHQFNVSETATRGQSSDFGRMTLKLGSVSYDCEEYGLEALVDRGMRAQYATELDLLEAQAFQVMQSVLIAQEVRAAAAINNTTTFPLSGNTGLDGDTWSSASSDIIGNIQSGKNGIAAQCGLIADSLLVNHPTWNYLWKNTAIRGSFSNVIPAGLPSIMDEGARRLMAATLGVDNIIVGTGVYSDNHEEASPSVSPIWSSTYAFLFKKAPADMLSPGLARMPYWATADGGGAGLGQVERYMSEDKRGEVVRYVQHVDELITMAEAGFLLKID